MRCIDCLWGREKFRALASATGVPAFGKWNKRPGQPVVVGCFWRLIESQSLGQEVLLRSGLDWPSPGIQQSIEFSFAHRALPVSENARSQKSLASRLSRSLKLYRSGDRGCLGYRILDVRAKRRTARARPSVRRITFGQRSFRYLPE